MVTRRGCFLRFAVVDKAVKIDKLSKLLHLEISYTAGAGGSGSVPCN